MTAADPHFWNDFKRHGKLAVVLFLILFLRLISLGWLALSDPTESRYADMALKMLQDKQWVTPEILIDGREVPYWGKPPLHFWMTALSFRVFGISEWSSRFPAYVSGLAITFLTFMLAFRLRGVRTALLACLILTSSALFFVLTGESAIDVTLSATVTGAMVAFALNGDSPGKKGWGIAFFAFLAAGMLAKGPIAILLVFFAVGLWLTVTKQWMRAKALPWKGGVIVFLMLTVPWYTFAEIRTPGFLRYFLLHENLLRYLIHDYGDKYGSGHVYPYGATWIILLLTFLPWTAALLFTFCKAARVHFVDQWQTYCFCWGLTPVIFFTLSRQILATYLLPGFAGLAIAISFMLTESRISKTLRLLLKGQVLSVIVLICSAVLIACWYRLPFLLLISGFVFLALAIVICKIFFRESTNACVSLTAIGFAILITTSTFVFRPTVDERDSVKGVLSFLLNNPVYSHDTVIFPLGIPYSALFYEERLTHQDKFLAEPHQRDLKSLDQDVFVFSRGQWKSLAGATKSRLFPIYATAHWVVCRERQY